jgi:hypothetical protein
MGDDRSSVFTDSDRESVSRFSTRSEVSTMTSSRQRTKKSSGFDSDTPNSPLRVVDDATKSPTPNTAKTHRRTIQQHVQDSMAQATLNGVWNPNVSILSPRATGKAFSKFVSRATPITNAIAYFNHVYHWQQPVVSFSYLIFWSLLCKCLVMGIGLFFFFWRHGEVQPFSSLGFWLMCFSFKVYTHQ